MEKNRVDCSDCVEFIPAVFKNEFMIISGIKTNAKCKLGKRIAFIHSKDFNDKINEK